MVGDLVGAHAHLTPDLGVLVPLELFHVVPDDHVGRRVLEPQLPQLQPQALREVAGGDAGGIEVLHHTEGLLDLVQRVGTQVGDLGDRGPQHPVLVDVLDDGVADLQQQLVGDRHVQLPAQMVVEIGLLGERVLDRGQLGHLGGPRAPPVAVVEVVLEELLDVDVLQGVGALLLLLGLLVGDLVRGGLLRGHLLQQRILHDLLLEHLGQLECRQGQQLDRLLEGRREDEPLREALREA